MTHTIPGHPPKDNAETYACKGHSLRWNSQPANIYHPSQAAWLKDRNLYTGRIVADVVFLPDDLKFL